MKIVIAGGSGQVGRMLARRFHQQGHEVVVLSRSVQETSWRVIRWDGISLGPWAEEFECSDICINLAGRSVNCRYTEVNRRSILNSRVQATEILNQALGAARRPPKVWLNASTATIYRHALDRPMDESSGEIGGNEPGASKRWNYSVQVAQAWEEAFFSTTIPGVRKVALRSAIVLSPDLGGIFDVLLGLVRHGLGGTNLPGNQFISWIHEVDFVRSVEFLVERQDLSGAVNLSSPYPLTNSDFMRILRETWGIRFGLPTTRLSLELGAFFLRTESELVLKSRRVVPGRLLAAGFQFSLSKWQEAAEDLVAEWKRLRAVS